MPASACGSGAPVERRPHDGEGALAALERIGLLQRRILQVQHQRLIQPLRRRLAPALEVAHLGHLHQQGPVRQRQLGVRQHEQRERAVDVDMVVDRQLEPALARASATKRRQIPVEVSAL